MVFALLLGTMQPAAGSVRSLRVCVRRECAWTPPCSPPPWQWSRARAAPTRHREGRVCAPPCLQRRRCERGAPGTQNACAVPGVRGVRRHAALSRCFRTRRRAACWAPRGMERRVHAGVATQRRACGGAAARHAPAPSRTGISAAAWTLSEAYQPQARGECAETFAPPSAAPAGRAPRAGSEWCVTRRGARVLRVLWWRRVRTAPSMSAAPTSARAPTRSGLARVPTLPLACTPTPTLRCVCSCAYMYLECVCACVCVFVREKGRAGRKEGRGEYVCVCVCAGVACAPARVRVGAGVGVRVDVGACVREPTELSMPLLSPNMPLPCLRMFLLDKILSLSLYI